MSVGMQGGEKRMRKQSTLLRIIATSLCVGLFAVPLSAEEDFRVDTLRYRNDGGYWAKVAVAYLDGGSLCLVERRVRVGAGNTVDFKLGGKNDSWEAVAGCTKAIPQGREVWMIASVETAPGYWVPRTCHKDETHFYANQDDGGTIKYRTRGTTQHNNRCRINNRPSSDFLIDPPRKHGNHK